MRKAFKMQLKEGREIEYQKRHTAIWPDLCNELSRCGISHYSIFLDEETLILFAVMEIVDEPLALSIAQTAICKKWWLYMSDIMESNNDHSPKSVPLKEMFYLK